MGLLQKIKGWLNIGGVQVLLWKYTEPVMLGDPVINGAVLLKAKSARKVLSVEIKMVEEITRGKGQERKTESAILGLVSIPKRHPGLDYPLQLQAGDSIEQPFTMYPSIPPRPQHQGGVMGAVGKLSAFASSETLEYYLVATADVEGTPFDPSHKVKIKVAG